MYENKEIDLDGFGYREIDMASKLMMAYSNGNTTYEASDALSIMDDAPKIGFNPQSGYVFMFDEDGNTYMINNQKDGKLDLYIECVDCQNEEFASEFRHAANCEQCACSPIAQ